MKITRSALAGVSLVIAAGCMSPLLRSSYGMELLGIRCLVRLSHLRYRCLWKARALGCLKARRWLYGTSPLQLPSSSRGASPAAPLHAGGFFAAHLSTHFI